MEDDLITTREVSRWLGVTEGTIAHWRVVGIGPPYVKVPKKVRYRVRDVREWLGRNRQPAGETEETEKTGG